MSFSEAELERPTTKEPEAESPPRQIKTISTAIFNRALAELRASKIELVNALKEGRSSNLNNEKITEQEDDVANPSATNTGPKASLMERRSTAHVFEVNRFLFCFIISSMLLSLVFLCLNS